MIENCIRQPDPIEGFERVIEMHPAYDKSHDDPKKNYGVHGVDMRFVLIGPHGAISFALYTNWHLPHVQERIDSRAPSKDLTYTFHQPIAADLSYHIPFQYDECQSSYNCEYLPEGKCFIDGSGLMANIPMTALREKGLEGVFEVLHKYYTDWIEVKWQAEIGMGL